MDETRTYSSDEDSFTRRPSSPSPTDPTPRHTQLSPSSMGTGTAYSTTYAESPVIGHSIPRRTHDTISSPPRLTIPSSQFTSQTGDTHKEVYMSTVPAEYLSTTSPEYIPPASGPEAVPFSDDPEVHHEPGLGPPSEDGLKKSASVEAVAAVPASTPDVVEKELASKPESRGIMVKKWKIWAVGALLVVLIVVAVVVGVVLGTRNNGGGNDNSSSSSNDGGDGNSEEDDGAPTLTDGSVPPHPTYTSTVAVPDEEDLAIGVAYNSTFTYYGSEDEDGAWNCRTHIIGCGFTTDVSFFPYMQTFLPPPSTAHVTDDRSARFHSRCIAEPVRQRARKG